MPRPTAALILSVLMTASVPASLQAQSAYSAAPGTVNFVQGQANVDGRPLASGTAAAQHHQLASGETLATASGSADILLAPGALLRIGSDSTVRMIVADSRRTEVRLEQGTANISVNVVSSGHLLLLDMQDGQTQVLSRGLYTFSTGTNTIRVFNGEAYLFPGAALDADVKPVTVKEGHQVLLAGERPRPEKFDRELADTDLLPWTGPSEARVALADSSLWSGGGAGSFDDSHGYASYYPAYGFAGGYADAYYGGGYPYGPWGPYGFYGYPFFGVGFGYWGGGYGTVYRNYPPIKGPGRFGGAAQGGFAGRGFAPRTSGAGVAGGRGFGRAGGAGIGRR